MDKGFFATRFYTKEAYAQVLEGGPWTVFGNYLTVSKWRPNFISMECAITIILIRYDFRGVSIDVFKEDALMWLGNTIEKAIRVDLTSGDLARRKFARVCMKVDISKLLIPCILALGRVFSIEYKGLPKICYNCGVYGHKMEECPSLRNTPQLDVPPSSGSQHASNILVPGPSSANQFGPWMIPTHIRRRQEQRRNQMSR